MSYCPHCGQAKLQQAAACTSCGSSQIPQKELPTQTPPRNLLSSFIMLCVLTIMGSLLGMVRGFFYQEIAEVFENESYWRGWAFLILNIGTLLGAIIMLQKKAIGLAIYTVFQLGYIGMIIYTTSIYHHGSGGILFSTVISSIFLIPAVGILIIYWTVFGWRFFEQYKKLG